MNLRSLAARNVWRNRGRYLAYLGSAAFSVMIYFLYTSLAHHPYFAGGYRGATYVLKGIQGASVVIAVFTLLFLLYSGAAFVRSRMKEFGLTVSRLTFKLQDNYRVLSAVAVLVAVILSAVGTIFAFYVVTEEDARMSNPQAIQLVFPSDADVEAEAAKVRAIVEGRGIDYLTEHVVRLPSAVLSRGQETMTVTLFPNSLYVSLYRPEGKLIAIDDESEAVLVHGYMPMLMEKPDDTVFTGSLGNAPGSLGNAPGSLGQPPGSLGHAPGALELSVTPDVSGKMLNGFNVGFNTLVLADAVYARWVADHPGVEYVPVVVWTGQNSRGPGMREAVEELRALYPWTGEETGGIHLSATIETYEELVGDFGLALFIGIFVSLVFFAATCSLLYFRLFTELDEDRRYYTRLRQLGLGSGELRRLAAGQAVVVFFVPFLFGLLHSAFAMRALSTLMMRSVLHFGGIVALAYLVPYTVYFLATFGLYWRTLRVGSVDAGAVDIGAVEAGAPVS